jgi:hypothetical protein
LGPRSNADQQNDPESKEGDADTTLGRLGG